MKTIAFQIFRPRTAPFLQTRIPSVSYFKSQPRICFYSDAKDRHHNMATVFRLIFYVPETHVEACKAAIFAAGAGIYPNSSYTECCWTTSGTGQFRPVAGANPHIGAVDKLESVTEVRVEAPCLGRDVAKAAVEALKKAHPYEEVAYEVYKLEDF
ncbi:GTP cyclohydrolase 1 type 2/Nif3 [Trichoderma sp. SZMC 28014]